MTNAITPNDKKTSRPRPPSDSGKIGIQPKKPLVGLPPYPIDPTLPSKPPQQSAKADK